MLKFSKKTSTSASISSVWGYKGDEATAEYIRAEKSVMAKFRRDQIVRVKNLDTGDVIYVPIRGAGEQNKKMFRTTIAMSYDNRARLGIKGQKGLKLQITETHWVQRWFKALLHSNSADAAANQANLLVAFVALVLAAIAIL